VRAEAYDQEARDPPFAADDEWRLEGASIRPPRESARLASLPSGRSRGLEVTVQRRSANGLSGWVSYGYGHAWLEDAAGKRFDTDFDQRHTLTVFGTYRLRHTLSLSTRYRYGSGFPIPGYYEERGGRFYLSERRNGLRPEAYSRWDVRANRQLPFRRWKMTLYAEVLNVLGRTHHRYTELDTIDGRTGAVTFENETLFPLLPVVGVTVEF
jgi:hypothetical protein